MLNYRKPLSIPSIKFACNQVDYQSMSIPPSAHLSHFMAGIFPICSFLHVPGKMSRPAWLSLGTAFLVEPPTAAFDERTSGIAMLTAAHTLQPWAYLTASALKELKLPEEFRKSRYIIGRVYLPDENGNALKGMWHPVKLSAIHPTLDVGLLSMGSPQDDVAAASPTKNTAPSTATSSTSSLILSPSLVECDRFRAALNKRHLLRRFRLSSRGLAACTEGTSSSVSPFEASEASVVGFRAKGLLGTMDTMDPRSLDALEPTVKAKLLAEMGDIEGRQEAATIGLRAVDGGHKRFIAGFEGSSSAKHRCASLAIATHGSAYHGMSGSPVVVGRWDGVVAAGDSPSASSSGWCCGVLHGMSSDPSALVGTIPSLAEGASLRLENGEANKSTASSQPSSDSPPPNIPAKYLSYIPSDEILEWCVRDLSGLSTDAELRRVLNEHDPLYHLTKKSESNPSEVPEVKPKSMATPTFVDPVTEDMLHVSDEDAAWIEQMKREKFERKN